jgi:hypothetical protein
MNRALKSELASLLGGLNTAIRDNIRLDGGLFDTLEEKFSQSDHYGHTCAALALAHGTQTDWTVGRLALKAWLALDERALGHLPFNRLALLLLREVLSDRGLDGADKDLLETGLRRCTLHRAYPSNNWSLLAQTCRLIDAPDRRKPAECLRLCTLLNRWTTTKGCFIDFPAHPGKRFSTPLAYHHKALFLASLACWFHDDLELARHARRLLDWLVHCWDPAGYAGGFGRSTHALFGDACLIAALILLGIEDHDEHQPVAALSRRLAHQRRADGFLWLNPAGHESGAASWDSYMHLSVYNAWAAAIIGTALHLRESRPPPTSLEGTKWTASRIGLFHDEEAGLAYLRTENGLNALLVTHGQPPQSYSSDEADFRYAGAILAHLRLHNTRPLMPPPVRLSRDTLLNTPAQAGWTPVIVVEGSHYTFDEFDTVSLIQTGNHLAITFTDSPRELFRPAARGLGNRVLATLDWRLFGGRIARVARLRRRRFEAARAKIQIELTICGGDLILFTRQIEIRSDTSIELLNPNGQTGIQDTSHMGPADSCTAVPPRNKLNSSIPEGTAFCLAPCTLHAGETFSERVELVFSANAKD